MVKQSRILKQSIFIGILFLFLASIIGCASGFTTIAPMPPKKYEKLGQVTGKACGSLVSPGGGTAYYFIPIMLNSRVDRAYEKALQSAPGATALIDVTIEEDWFWWVLGTARTVTISGEAIKEVTE
ncbi:MAG: hypothetical protein K8R28_10395 [Desulfobacterales bacterium]|nr:hypothetical protein [Desulfobacterales bacterium]